MTKVLNELVREKRVLVCCGAGGVGKTTTAAALAVLGARLGRRVLVLTIDPSKRLAQTLGVARNRPEPVRLAEERERAAGIAAPGSLSAWMLDPKLIADQAVRKLIPDAGEAEKLLKNRVYQQVTQMIAGMQEYTAMEALHGFVASGRYDLVVLDTPPSRNALNFLEAPGRLSRFVDGRIFKFFLPSGEGFIRGTTRKLIGLVLAGVFGSEFALELETFFGAFGGVFTILNGNAQRMRVEMRSDAVRFLLVTSPAREAVEDACFFADKIRELELPLGGFVLNRSRVHDAEMTFPDGRLLPEGARPAHRSALEKLAHLAERERRLVQAHLGIQRGLIDRVRGAVPVVALPEIGRGVDDLDGLVEVANLLAVR